MERHSKLLTRLLVVRRLCAKKVVLFNKLNTKFVMIELDNESGVYQPGDTISGRVVFTVDNQQAIKAFSLQISGYAATRWETIVPSKSKKKKKKHADSPDVGESKTQVYSNRDDYLASTLYFMGSEESVANVVNRGQYAYTFQTSLSDKAVSSFENPLFGHIRYELRALIDKHTHCQRQITVRRPYDLRREGALFQHYASEIVEKKSRLKFWQRPLVLNVYLPQNGYVPGELINVQVAILNHDQLRLHGITYKLNAIGTFWGRYKNKDKKTKMQSDRRTITLIEHPLDGQKSSELRHTQTIEVPADVTPTTELQHCKCIQITYELEVAVTCAHDHRRIVSQMPVKIGTISLHEPRDGQAGRLDSSEWASAPNLLVAERWDKGNGVDEEHIFEPSAPNDADVEPVEYPTSSNEIFFNEADFMKPVQLNSKRRGLGSVDQLDFKPRYMFYKMNSNT